MCKMSKIESLPSTHSILEYQAGQLKMQTFIHRKGELSND